MQTKNHPKGKWKLNPEWVKLGAKAKVDFLSDNLESKESSLVGKNPVAWAAAQRTSSNARRFYR
jgi:hypothetical protein